jgi:hypothetical protein
MLLFGLLLYAAITVGFLLWDAKIGFGFEWDGEQYPPLPLAALFWWITLPFVAMSSFVTSLDEAKKVRKKKEETRIRIKIEEEKAIEAAMEEVDREVADFNARLKAGSGK